MTHFPKLNVVLVAACLVTLVCCNNESANTPQGTAQPQDNTKMCSWIKNVSSLAMRNHWFTTDTSYQNKTFLRYGQRFEDSIVQQICATPHFNEVGERNQAFWDQIKNENLNGYWFAATNGFKFLQIKGHAKPMGIEINTQKNEIMIWEK